MILDYENMFSKEQAVTATASSTNTIDLGPGDAGPSGRVSLFVSADPAFSGAGSLSVDLQTSAAPDSGFVSIASFALTNAALTAGGKLIAARLPHGCKRYLRLNYAVTGALTAGKITAGLAWDVQAEEALPTGPAGI